MSQPDSPEGDGPAPQSDHGMWSTVQAAIDGGWQSTIRLLVILAGMAFLLIVVAKFGAGTPISALMQIIR